MTYATVGHAAKIDREISTMVEKPVLIPESHARELSRLKEPEAIRETYRQVTEANPQPTAKDIRAAVERRAEATPRNPDRAAASLWRMAEDRKLASKVEAEKQAKRRRKAKPEVRATAMLQAAGLEPTPERIAFVIDALQHLDKLG